MMNKRQILKLKSAVEEHTNYYMQMRTIDGKIKIFVKENPILTIGFLLVCVFMIALLIGNAIGVQEGIRRASDPSFWEKIDTLSYAMCLKFLILMVAIGYCGGKILHG